MEIAVGTLVTVFNQNAIAMTSSTHGKVIGVRPHPRKPEQVVLDLMPPKKRKGVSVALDESTLVFLAPVPFGSDMDRMSSGNGICRGNACLNLVADPAVIREWVEKKNLNPAFTSFDEVMAIVNEEEVPVFPEVESHHGVVEKIRAGKRKGM